MAYDRELMCKRDLALWLGAVDPKTMDELRAMKRSGTCMVVRDIETCLPLFWPMVSSNAKTRQV